MYIVHLPLVFALPTLIMEWDLHWFVKFPLLMAATLGLLPMSYQMLVRRTWLGAWLNGRRYPRQMRDALVSRRESC